MAEANTPLINELLYQVGQQPEFSVWQQEGKLPATTVKQLDPALHNGAMN